MSGIVGIDVESLQLIQDTAQAAADLKVIDMPNDPEKKILLGYGKEGEGYTVIDTPFVAPPRKHEVQSIDSFAAAFARWGAMGGEEASPANIWIDLPNWRLLFYTDEPLRRSLVTLRLTPSPQLGTVQQFEDETSLNQKRLVRMLRHDLDGCVDASVLSAFRSVDFQKLKTVRAAQMHDKQSLDQDVIATVGGPAGKVDGFVVEVPLFAMSELQNANTRIGITIDIDCDNCSFVLQAKPGHLQMALDDARAAVLTALENALATHGHSEVTILAGTP